MRPVPNAIHSIRQENNQRIDKKHKKSLKVFEIKYRKSY